MDKLDSRATKAESFGKYKSLLLSFMKVKSCSLFSIHDPIGIKLLTRLHLGFSHLNDHTFQHNFRDTECNALTVVLRLNPPNISVLPFFQ